MLLILPHEIIIQIARKLKLEDKLNLMMTCRKLDDLIKNRCLHERLLMIYDRETSEMIVEKFRSNQLDGHQVQELYYDIIHLSDDLFVQLPSVFPNVTKAVDICSTIFKKERRGTPIAQLEKWADRLEHYKGTEDWYKMASLMQTVTFPRLTQLNLICSSGPSWVTEGGAEDKNEKEDIRRTIRFHDCIEHAPALTSLHLHEIVITLSFLEKIHRSCPNLHTFEIKDSFFLMDDDTLPLSIVPAKNITRFVIEGLGSFCDRKCIFIDYVVQKYTNLRDCIFYPIMVANTDVLIKCYPDEFYSYYDKIGNSRMRALIEKINLTHELYRKEAANFLSRLPETIKGRFEFNADMFDDVPESLGLAKVKPIELIIQQRKHKPAVFTKPGHLGYLVGLTSVKHLELQIDPTIHLYEDEIASKSATKMTMFISKEKRYDDVNFGPILSAFPLLEKLIVYSEKNAFFIEDSIIQQQRIHLNLKNVFICIPTMDPNFLTRLSKQAPNIKKLILHLSDENISDYKHQSQQQDTMATRLCSLEKIDYTLDIRVFDLDQFELYLVSRYEKFRGVFTENDVYFRIKTGDITEKLVCCGGNYMKPAIKYDGVKETLPRVTILCDRVNQISLCGESIDITLNQYEDIIKDKVHVRNIHPVVPSCSYY